MMIRQVADIADTDPLLSKPMEPGTWSLHISHKRMARIHSKRFTGLSLDAPNHIALPDNDMNWKDLTDEAVSLSFAKATRFIGAGRQIAFTLDGEAAELHAALASPHDERDMARHDHGHHDIGVSFPGGALTFTEGRRLMRALTGIDFDAGASPNLREWLGAALTASLKDTPFHRAVSVGLPGTAALTDPLRLWISLSTASHAISTLASANADTWLSILHAAPWESRPAAPGPIDRIPFAMPVLLATHNIALSALAQINTGDVILPGAPAFQATGDGILAIGRMRLKVAYLDSNSLRVTKIFS